MPVIIPGPFNPISMGAVVSGVIDERPALVALSPTSVIYAGRNSSEQSGYVQKLSISGSTITFGNSVKFEADTFLGAQVVSITSASATRVVTGHTVSGSGVFLTNVDVAPATPVLLSGNTGVEGSGTAIFVNADQSGINTFSGVRRNGRNRYVIATVSGPTITPTETDDLLTPVASGDLVANSRRTGPSTGRIVSIIHDGGTFPTESLVTVDTFTTTRTNIIQISLPNGTAQLYENCLIGIMDTTHAVLLWKLSTAGGAGSDEWQIQSLKSVDTGTPALSGSPLTIPGYSGGAGNFGITRVCKLDSNRVFVLYQKSGAGSGPINYRIIDVSGASPVDSGTDVELTSNGTISINAYCEYLSDGNVIVAYQDDANLGGDVGLQVLTGL